MFFGRSYSRMLGTSGCGRGSLQSSRPCVDEGTVCGSQHDGGTKGAPGSSRYSD